jgi:hypothetical protein
MSRGLGWHERKVLRVMRDAEGALTLRAIDTEVRRHTFMDTPEPPRHRPVGASAFSRALRSLARKGLVRKAVLYHDQRTLRAFHCGFGWWRMKRIVAHKMPNVRRSGTCFGNGAAKCSDKATTATLSLHLREGMTR